MRPWPAAFCLVLAALGLAGGAAAAPTAAVASPAAPDPAAAAAFEFSTGKMLALEGSAHEAIAAYERALRLAPNDPYLHLEYASLLLRQAEYSAGDRVAGVRRAVEQAKAAAALAPQDVDVLRVLGQSELGLAETDPKAVSEARAAFEGILTQAPEDLPTLGALGQIYLEQGEAGKAADVLTTASRLRPDSTALSSMLLDALLKAERRDEAAKLLRVRLDGDPSDLASRLALADLAGDAGDHHGSTELLRGATGEQRSSSDVRRRLAIEEYRSGDLEGALAELEPLLAAEPGYVGGKYLRALVYAALARTADAEREFAALAQAQPENADFALNLSRVVERQGRRAEAEGYLQETLNRLEAAAAKDGKQSTRDTADRLRIALALSAMRGKEWERAEKVLTPLMAAKASAEWADEAVFIVVDARVEAKRGDDALALLDGHTAPAFAAKRCEILQRLSRTDQARDCFSRLEALPGDEGLLQAADARQRLEDFAGSIPLLEQARAREPESVDVQYRLASAYERTGQRTPAVTLLRGILAKEPDNASALNYLGYMLAEHGENLQEALSMAERAVELDPDNGAYVDSLGWAHFQLGQYDRARQYLERAAGLMPEDPTVCEHLGDTYAKVGDTQKARSTYRKVLDLGGENSVQVERKLRDLPGGS
ncbi:MAG: tetratricopeptide repeat protein [Acidobacteriota bacterium]